eukprot:11492235-Alexandrium_andersonii.AAC.1
MPQENPRGARKLAIHAFGHDGAQNCNGQPSLCVTQHLLPELQEAEVPCVHLPPVVWPEHIARRYFIAVEDNTPWAVATIRKELQLRFQDASESPALLHKDLQELLRGRELPEEAATASKTERVARWIVCRLPTESNRAGSARKADAKRCKAASVTWPNPAIDCARWRFEAIGSSTARRDEHLSGGRCQSVESSAMGTAKCSAAGAAKCLEAVGTARCLQAVGTAKCSAAGRAARCLQAAGTAKCLQAVGTATCSAVAGVAKWWTARPRNYVLSGRRNACKLNGGTAITSSA